MPKKSHYNDFQDFTYVDETAWDFCYALCLDIIGKSKITTADWEFLLKENTDALLNYDLEDREAMLLVLKHVMLAEKAYSGPVDNTENITDTELVALAVRKPDNKREIINKLGSVQSPDENLNYYYFFSSILVSDISNKEDISKAIVKLAKKYSENNIVSKELQAAYAASLIIIGKTKKGLTLFDNLIEDDKLNTKLYVQVCEALAHTNQNEIAKRYLSGAIETAYTIEDENLANSLIEIFNLFFQDELHESLNPNSINLEDIIKDNLPDKEKLILRQIEEKHPEEMEILLYGNNDDEIDKAYTHMQEHARVEIIITTDKSSLEHQLFTKLIDAKVPEHRAVHEIIERLNK